MDKKTVLNRDFINKLYLSESAEHARRWMSGYFQALEDFGVIETWERQMADAMNSTAYEENKYSDIDPDWERE